VVRIDTVAPKLKISGPSNTRMKTDAASAIFALKASEEVRRRCRIDFGQYEPCHRRYRTAKLSRSAHTLTVRVTDRAGNVDTKRKWFTLVSAHVPRGTPRAPSDPSCHGAAATLTGSYRSDRLTGTDGPDVIVSFGGNDKINGRGGRDVICARHGNDQVRAGAGADWVRGGLGSDGLGGGRGADTIRAGWGVDDCARDPADRAFRCELLGLG
jgi:hypothetical protein